MTVLPWSYGQPRKNNRSGLLCVWVLVELMITMNGGSSRAHWGPWLPGLPNAASGPCWCGASGTGARGDGKNRLTTTYRWYLATWAKRLSCWKEVGYHFSRLREQVRAVDTRSNGAWRTGT